MGSEERLPSTIKHLDLGLPHTFMGVSLLFIWQGALDLLAHGWNV